MLIFLKKEITCKSQNVHCICLLLTGNTEHIYVSFGLVNLQSLHGKINKDFILTRLNSITYSKFCSETLLLANAFPVISWALLRTPRLIAPISNTVHDTNPIFKIK